MTFLFHVKLRLDSRAADTARMQTMFSRRGDVPCRGWRRRPIISPGNYFRRDGRPRHIWSGRRLVHCAVHVRRTQWASRSELLSVYTWRAVLLPPGRVDGKKDKGARPPREIYGGAAPRGSRLSALVPKFTRRELARGFQETRARDGLHGEYWLPAARLLIGDRRVPDSGRPPRSTRANDRSDSAFVRNIDRQ